MRQVHQMQATIVFQLRDPGVHQDIGQPCRGTATQHCQRKNPDRGRLTRQRKSRRHRQRRDRQGQTAQRRADQRRKQHRRHGGDRRKQDQQPQSHLVHT